MFDTNRPSSSISRHITVDLYRTLWCSNVYCVDAGCTSTGVVDLRTVMRFNCNKRLLVLLATQTAI